LPKDSSKALWISDHVTVRAAVEIEAGWHHTCALTTAGGVNCWGNNHDGQLGDGTNIDRSTPVQASSLSNVKSIAAGYGHAVALKTDGTIWTFGWNGFGQLGDGSYANRSQPVQSSGFSNIAAIAAGYGHTVALRNDGTVWTVGDNHVGQFASGDTTPDRATAPAQAIWISGVAAITAGNDFTLALKGNGMVWAWGSGSFGQSGSGTPDARWFPYEVTEQSPGPPPVGTLSLPTFDPDGGAYSSTQAVRIRSSNAEAGISDVSTGGSHFLVRLSDGSFYGWGNNYYAQLGFSPGGPLPDPAKYTITTPLQVSVPSGVVAHAAGGNHNLLLKSDGTVWAWGASFQGQLGVAVPNASFRTTIEQVSGLTGVKAIYAGGATSIAVKTDGTVWGWGDITPSSGLTSAQPVQLSNLTNAKSISPGAAHILVVKSDGTVSAWGYNSNGELGNGTNNNSSTPVPVSGLSGVSTVASGGDFSLALKSDGTVWAWGANVYGQLGIGADFSAHNTPVQVQGLSNVVAIAAGGQHALALKSDGTVWGWGTNWNGELGDGTGAQQRTPVQIPAFTNAKQIGAGYQHSFAFKTDGSLWITGMNDYGQIGDSTTEKQFSPKQMTRLNGGVTIHYTTNGADPTESDPTINSGGSIQVDRNLTLKARVWKQGWTQSSIKTAVYTINTPNPIDDARTFIRQHYLDFLGREPDQSGLDYWTSQITQCGTDQQCIHDRRVGVSAAFYIELEFQETGSVIYRMYRASFGTLAGTPTRANITYSQFSQDRPQLVAGQALQQSTVNFANQFVQRAEFKTAYPDTMTNTEFVNKLYDTAGLTPYTNERQAQVTAMQGGKTRAQVLLDVIEIPEFKTTEYNRAFVLMQYFGYLRRDADQGGYDFWLDVLNRLPPPNNFRNMVCAFITSSEYQLRFGQTVTRHNSDCASN